ncbi:hypothetical protein FOZ60_010026 [Perkinsus olseni]|uniref:Uncharacterized protein n=1 Tax=Perkinsus olseni TaxID=32597 RepID=A0A7J6NHB9_PEROL|nr:hypothetical protein FOZ60_010026 [Perkinsus olseni]
MTVLTTVQRDTFIKFKELYPTRGLPLAKRLYPREFAEVTSHDWSRLVHELGYSRSGDKRVKTSAGPRRGSRVVVTGDTTPTSADDHRRRSSASEPASLPDGVRDGQAPTKDPTEGSDSPSNSQPTPYMKFLAVRHRELKEQGALKLITPRDITATILCEWEAMTEDQRIAYGASEPVAVKTEAPSGDAVAEDEECAEAEVVFVEGGPPPAGGIPVDSTRDCIIRAELCSDEE